MAAYARADDRGDALGAANLGAALVQQGDEEAALAVLRRADERGSARLRSVPSSRRNTSDSVLIRATPKPARLSRLSLSGRESGQEVN